MTEPVLFGLPLSAAFFYFIVYAVLGWCWETVYCSVLERRFVSRGFLYGPLCPIYGVGVLMMICWFRPLLGQPLLFYAVAVVCMSAWEYLVGWFLETTTHIKYWDYSKYRFNLQGRICLWVSLGWGALSYLVLHFIHPYVELFFQRFGGVKLYFVDGVFLGALLFDAGATIYQLARTAQLLEKLRQTGEELRLEMEVSRSRIEEAKANLAEHWEELAPAQLGDAGKAAKERYDELMANTEQVSRRFRHAYRAMRSSDTFTEHWEGVKRREEKVKTLLNRALLKDPDEVKK